MFLQPHKLENVALIKLDNYKNDLICKFKLTGKIISLSNSLII